MAFLKLLFVFTVISILTSRVLSYSTFRDLPLRNHNVRIVSGFQAQPGQFPHQALLQITLPQGSAVCGGSLLNNEWVITAAHCALSATQFKISLGAQTFDNPSEPGRVIDITSTKIVHSGYTPFSTSNDLSLIKLSKKIEFTDRIQPVLLPKTEDLFEQQDVIASGWGLESTAAQGVASELQWAPMHIISNGVCVKSYDSIVVRATTIFAQGNERESVCNGDSGGPLCLFSTFASSGPVVYPTSVNNRNTDSLGPTKLAAIEMNSTRGNVVTCRTKKFGRDCLATLGQIVQSRTTFCGKYLQTEDEEEREDRGAVMTSYQFPLVNIFSQYNHVSDLFRALYVLSPCRN